LLNRKWVKIEEVGNLESLEFPGVYVLGFAKGNVTIEGKAVKKTIASLKYVGMSNNASGIHARIKQFKRGVTVGCGHSAGNRLYNPDNALSLNRVFVAFVTVNCIIKKSERTEDDLKHMGLVNCLEYYVLSKYREIMSCEPEWNKR
jgi:hypothetical protein